MISVRNRLPLSSGNKGLLLVCVALIIGACSPKARTVYAPPAAVEKPVAKVPPPPPRKPVVPGTAKIAMLLPFSLDKLNEGARYSKIALENADLALDYYQGFKLALDSLTAKGYNFRLQLFDTKDQPALAHSLAYNATIRNSDLIVGPVFPGDLSAFSSVLTSARKPIVSPLSPTSPSTYRNQNIVTIATPLEYHAWGAAAYISGHIKPAKVFILSSGYSEDNSYIVPFNKAMDSLAKNKIKVISLTIVRGDLSALTPQLSTTAQNVFIMPATNQAFLTVTLRSLDSLGRKFPVTLFGHPSWAKFSFLKYQTLQRLKTHITSSEKVNYKSPDVIAFIRSYRNAYHLEPTSYAIKGFDEGLYFGLIMGENPNNLKNLEHNDFTGLHNNFHFVKKPGLGWINTHVGIYQYSNFELKKIE